MICLVECKDTVKNLKKVLQPVKNQLSELQTMSWRGKSLKLFLFGDLDFLLKMFGLSGAQSIHPCLWCIASRKRIQKAPSQQPSVPHRTMNKIKQDYRRYKRAGKPKKKAQAFNNVVTSPIWDIELSHVTPPYLHLKLGIVKKHHDLLEKDCHTLDEQIAQSPATCQVQNTSLPFRTNFFHKCTV